ncbi:MAG: ATP-dependent DNA helicase [bacterium]|nr:ATP-dependent DNA helicase [bacterium]
MPLDLKQLNKEQLLAVKHKDGPLLIVAGAGTGKTTVIAKRFVYLIEQKLAKPEEILALTFTEKAANEMEERVENMLEIGFHELWISTFHSFCEKILRNEGLKIGLGTDFKLVQQTSAWMLLREHLAELDLNYYKPLGNPARFLHGLLAHFSKCKDQGITPENYLEYAQNLKTNLTDLPEDFDIEQIKEQAEAYHFYQQLLLKNNLLDFGDLLNYTLLLFEKRPFVLEKYQKKFKYILVDEFQDTNHIQYQLVKLLVGKKANLTACGDDLQAIYRFRGASFANLVQFKKDFPKTAEISLVQNYRSCQSILDLAYSFIKDNDPLRNKYFSNLETCLKAQTKETGEIEHFHLRNLDAEAQQVAEKIIALKNKEKGLGLSDFAILVRANDTAQAFCRALERANIAFQFLANKGLYQKPVIIDTIAYFKLLDNYHETSALFRILHLPFFKFKSEEVMLISNYASKKTKSLFEALKELYLIKGISPETKEKATFLLGLLEKHQQMAKEKNVSEVFVQFVRESGYLKYILDNEDKPQIDSLNLFYEKLKTFEQESLSPRLSDFMEKFSLELESGEEGDLIFDSDEGPDLVRVMTIHAAKGLEFKYVFLVSLVDRRFPSIERQDKIEIPEGLLKEKAPEGDVHLQEERRLCYVAMTRAKNGLFFTSSTNYGGKQKKKLSRFLIEMGFNQEAKNKAQTKNDFKEEPQELESIVLEENSLFLPNKFSFSQLNEFEQCPLRYKYKYVYKLFPKGKAVFSFGTTIHNTLQKFLKLKNEKIIALDLFGNEKEENKNKVNLADLMEIYKKSWEDDWYESKKQKEAYRKLGKTILKSFYEKAEKDPPNIFTFDDGSLALEVPFALDIEGYNLRGRIDRIDNAKDGVVIIDYKTGKAKEKLEKSDKEQLLLYQIAVKEVYGLEVAQLKYNYLEEEKEVAFLGKDGEMEELKAKIVNKIEQIRQGQFEATPGFNCQFCDFNDICPSAQKP